MAERKVRAETAKSVVNPDHFNVNSNHRSVQDPPTPDASNTTGERRPQAIRSQTHFTDTHWLSLRKGVSDLHRRAKISQESNERYLESLAAVEHTESLGKTVCGVCLPNTLNGRL